MIEQEYISFETAKLAKEKGFNEPCKYFYEEISGEAIKWECVGDIISTKKNEFLCPTQSLLARWLREKHNICVEVNFTSYGFVWCVCNTNNTEDKYGSGESGPNKNGTWDNYEEAMETCLQEALKFI